MSEKAANAAAGSTPQDLAGQAEPKRRQGRFRASLNWLSLAGIICVGFFVLVAVIGPFFDHQDPTLQDLVAALAPPSASHLLGTDDLGRDYLSRLLYGGRLTLFIGLMGSTCAMVAGVLIGLFAGFYGTTIETVLMRSMDVLLAFPGLILALGLVSVFGFGVTNIIVAIAAVLLPTFARLARSSTLSVQSTEYVVAIRAVGASNSRILFRYVLPNVLNPIVTLWALQIGTSIMIASGLGYLGLGVQPPTPEWGAMLSSAQLYMQTVPRLVVIPGVCIALTVLGFSLVGDWLRDFLDPRLV